jgi:rRNA maturation endonuclease Nob1
MSNTQWQIVCAECGWTSDGRETNCAICGAKLEDAK